MTDRRSWRGRLAEVWVRSPGSQRWAVVILLALPLVVFVLPALFGHPVVAGDNQIQNYPLRVLSGQILRSGHLPLWDPWIWSGSPLLGGLNAGSLYPGTWIYAVLPGLVAWTVNLVFLYWVAAFGVYVLARVYGLVPLASLLGAVSFGFAGSMTAQMVHLGVVQGAAWIPWMVLGELRLAQIFVPGIADTRTLPDEAGRGHPEPSWRDALPWVLLVGCSGGLIFLVGEPRSMADAAWICVLCAAWWLFRSYRPRGTRGLRRGPFVAAIASGGLLAVLTGGVQLFSGVSFLSATQRSTATLSFFGSGSLQPRWSALLLVPDIFGGDGILHQPQYFAGYNLPEVTGYIGIFACIGAFTLLARSFGRSRSADARTWSIWLIVLAVGLVLCFGTYSPLGGPLSHIPFYGGLRLQSRNLTIVDLGLAMLLAFWVNTVVCRRTSGGREDRRVHWQDVVGLVPAFVAAALCVALIAVPSHLESALGVTGGGAGSATGLWPWALLQLAVSIAAIALVLRWPKLSAAGARRWLAAAFTADLLLFSVACSTGFVAGKGVPVLPVASQAASLGSGRFAIYDPPVVNLPGLIKVGETDLNALTRHPSVQGYGSVVGKTYDDVTGTHFDGTLSPCALQAGSFAPLGLTTILALPASVAPQAAEGLAPAPGSAGCGIDWPREGAMSRTWLFETAAAVDTVDLAVPAGNTGSTGSTGNAAGAVTSVITGALRIGLLNADGAIEWPTVVSHTITARGISIRFGSPVRATGLVAKGPGASAIADTTIVIGPATRLVLDGPLQDALDEGGWHYAGHIDGFVRYELSAAPRTVWIEGGGQGARTVRVSTTNQGAETDLVTSAHAVTVVRSEAYLPGWRVEATNIDTGKTVALATKAVGLVQAVDLPAGSYRIRWSYWAPGLSIGLASSAVGSLFVLMGALVLVVGKRRLRGRPREDGQ